MSRKQAVNIIPGHQWLVSLNVCVSVRGLEWEAEGTGA